MAQAGPISSTKNTAEPVACPIAHWTGGPEAQILAPIGAALCRARTRAVVLSWCSCARQAALRYSLINPWTTCVRPIRPVMSTGWQSS